MRDANLAARPEQKANAGSCSVLVCSCDAYSDLWTPFFTLFWRNWPDCPYPVYLGANRSHYDDPRVQTLQAGSDESWSKSLRLFLNRIDTEYVLFLLEDFFLTQRVSTAEINRHLEALHAFSGTALRLFPNPPPDRRANGHDSIGSIHYLAPFRVSAQAGIWNRAALLNLLRDGENAWEFELNATARSRSNPDGFYCTLRPVLPYVHVVERGRWFPHAARRFREANIGCNFEARSIMPASMAATKAVHSVFQGVANRMRNLWLRTQPVRTQPVRTPPVRTPPGGHPCHGSRS